VNLSQFIKEGDKGPFSFYLGRSSDCQIVLEGREISRKQAEISFADGVWSINNLSPSIPLIINGIPTQKANLETGTDIFLGPYRIFVVSVEKPLVAKDIPSEEVTPKEGEDEKTEEEEVPGDFEEGEDLGFSDSEDGETETEAVSADSETATFGDMESGEEGEEGEEGVSFDDDESGFGEEDGGFDDGQAEDDDGMGDTEEATSDLPFVEFQLDLFGEYAPYEKFKILDKETFIGRDPKKCSIILNDPEVSAVHAVIKKKLYQCELEDLGSKNGTLLNGKRINRNFLANEDEFIIGSTTFSVSAHTSFLEQESSRLMPVEDNQVIDVEHEVELEAAFEEEEGAEEGAEVKEGEKPKEPKKKISLLEQIKTDPVKKKRAIMIGVVLVLGLLLIDTGPDEATEKQKADAIAKTKKKKKEEKKEKPKYKPEQLDYLDSTYLLAKELFKQGKYAETLFELQKIFSITPDYKNAKQINELAKRGLAKMEEIEKKRREEIARKKREQRVKDLVAKAEVAVKERQAELSKGLFSQILKLDPENYEVTQLKLEIESWEKEAQRKQEEEDRIRRERDKKVEQLSPGKSAYLAKEWYKAIVRLDQFLQIGGMDEDLIKKASEMLTDAKKQLANIVDPILEKAEGLMEGQDLKGAYEEYKKVLFFDPSKQKPLEEMERIQNRLTVRARKIYREAIVAESLSLFQDAKTKFLEVQQVSPSDSEYYMKATEKLKNYLDYE